MKLPSIIMGRSFALVALMVAMSAYVGTGCGGGGGGAAAVAGATTGALSATSLGSVPTADLSSYDATQSAAASADISSIPLKSMGLKGDAPSLRNVSSVAGCHADSLKQEMTRISQQAELSKCYFYAMEKANLITIPIGSTAIYSITPPAERTEDRQKKCEDISDEDSDGKANCLKVGEGPGGGVMLFRIGVVDNNLQMDECEGGVLSSEATYSVSGNTAIADVSRSGSFNGNKEGGSFHMEVDNVKSVTDSIVTLNSGGTAMATAKMNSARGTGNSTFATDGSTITVSGVFNPSFTDPFTKVGVSGSKKIYAKMGGDNNIGTAKGSITMINPPMRLSGLIPFDVPASQKAAFMAMLEASLGVTLTANSELCPTPGYSSSDSNKTPLILATNGVCPVVTLEIVESFQISNAKRDGNYRRQKISQIYMKTDNANSPYYDEVDAFDLSTLTSDSTVAFTRNWDCSGSAIPIRFAALTEEEKTSAQTYMESCFAIEEMAHGNQGMGMNCQAKAANNTMQELKEKPEVGEAYNGSYRRPDAAPEMLPEKISIKAREAADTFCIPDGMGGCGTFVKPMGETTASGLNLNIPSGGVASDITITKLVFSSVYPPISGVTITFSKPGLGTMDVLYTKADMIAFDKPKECTASDLPAACIAKGITDCGKCGDYCMTPGAGCMPK